MGRSFAVPMIINMVLLRGISGEDTRDMCPSRDKLIIAQVCCYYFLAAKVATVLIV